MSAIEQDHLVDFIKLQYFNIYFILFYLKSQHDIIQFKNEYRMIKKSHQASNIFGLLFSTHLL